MKKFIISSIAVLCIGFVAAQTVSFPELTPPVKKAKKGQPAPEAPEIVLNYGTVKKDSDGVRKILVKNTGKKPLIITNVTSSCGCTIPEWTKEPILPKKTGFVDVKYNTSIVGAISKAITVNSNDPETPSKIIKIKGEVTE